LENINNVRNIIRLSALALLLSSCCVTLLCRNNSIQQLLQ